METVKKNKNKIYLAIIVVAVIVMVVLLVDYKKNVPAEWIQRLTDYYGLSPEEKTQLETSVEESRLQYKIIPGNAGTNQRRAALQFARSFDEMDDETALKILELLRNKEDID